MLPLAALFREVGRCYVPDLAGFGESPPPPAAWGSLEYMRDVVEWLDAEGIEQFDIVGHSFGARIAMQLAAHFPARVRSIVLIGGAGLRPQRSLRRRLRAQSSRWIGLIAKRLPKPWSTSLFAWREQRFGSADFRASKGVMRGVLSRVVAEDLSEQAKAVVAPTLLLYGSLDTETPVEMGNRYHQLIANSRLQVLEGHGHFAFSGGGAHLCATFMKRFYAQVPAAPIT